MKRLIQVLCTLFFVFLIVDGNASDKLDKKISVPSFAVEVKLSDKARELLRQRKEKIIISAYFYGYPKHNSKCKPSIGEAIISLGNSEKELITDGIVKFDRYRIVKKCLDSLVDSDYMINVHVASSRKTKGENLLDCGIIDDHISMLQGKMHTISCTIIGEIKD
jgi:hypothetical protein